MRTSFLWTEEGVSDLAAPPVDHGATLQDPGGLPFISLTHWRKSARNKRSSFSPLLQSMKKLLAAAVLIMDDLGSFLFF